MRVRSDGDAVSARAQRDAGLLATSTKTSNATPAITR